MTELCSGGVFGILTQGMFTNSYFIQRQVKRIEKDQATGADSGRPSLRFRALFGNSGREAREYRDERENYPDRLEGRR